MLITVSAYFLTGIAASWSVIFGKVEAVKKKDKKGAPVKPFQAKNHLWLFVNCLVENPTFDSQTKETMTLRAGAFGSKFTVSDDFMKKGNYFSGS